jgi:hypothetical protein
MIVLRIVVLEARENGANHIIFDAHNQNIGATKREVDTTNFVLGAIKQAFEEKAPNDPEFKSMMARFEEIKE